ncbi:MAG TPA: YraN family protein [Stellaceae bacterium]|nr:YraN family protein [Stellaceae bacterium]
MSIEPNRGRRGSKPWASHRKRQAAWRRGQAGELLCLWLLRLKGYRVLARHFRVAAGEIDLIARRGSHLVAVEVKTRREIATAIEAVTTRQRRRIARAFAHFLRTRPDLAPLTRRFDVMLITRSPIPVHIKDAWRIN